MYLRVWLNVQSRRAFYGIELHSWRACTVCNLTVPKIGSMCSIDVQWTWRINTSPYKINGFVAVHWCEFDAAQGFEKKLKVSDVIRLCFVRTWKGRWLKNWRTPAMSHCDHVAFPNVTQTRTPASFLDFETIIRVQARFLNSARRSQLVWNRSSRVGTNDAGVWAS